MSLNAVQTAELTNTSGQPLLPGKVCAEGAFVGTTETEFVAPGENFSMFMGVADQLKLSRTLDQKRSSLTWSGKRKRMLAAFVVAVENLSEKPAAFQLADRIPVSETEDIRVMSVRLQPEVKPDVKGLIKWDVTLPARTKREFRLEYTLDYPPELPQAQQVPQRSWRERRSRGPWRPARPHPDLVQQSESLYRQIDVLEKEHKEIAGDEKRSNGAADGGVLRSPPLHHAVPPGRYRPGVAVGIESKIENADVAVLAANPA